jgi:hypothetical protein
MGHNLPVEAPHGNGRSAPKAALAVMLVPRAEIDPKRPLNFDGGNRT